LLIVPPWFFDVHGILSENRHFGKIKPSKITVAVLWRVKK
jgi:hypothetical protein